MIVQLPLSTDTPQTFSIQLGDSTYQFTLRWNDRSSVWQMDMADATSGDAIVSGIGLVLGTDLLLPYSLGIGGLMVVDETGTHTEATLDSLGSTTNVYWLSSDELTSS
jgi:hypothetical protein